MSDDEVGTSAGKILVVEDDRSSQILIANTLRAGGFEVVAVDGAEPAVEAIRTQKFDLACLDLALPDHSGFWVCDQIRRVMGLSVFPIVVITARVTLEDRSRAMEFGVAEYVTKPFRPRALLGTINAVLRRSKR